MYTYDTKRKAAVSSSNSLPIQREIAFSPRTNTYISIPGRVPAFDLAYKKGYARSHTFSHQSIEQIIVNYLNSLEHDTIGLIDSLQIIGGACEEIEYSCRCLGTLISSKAGFMEIVASARKLTSLVSMKSFNLRYGNIKGNQSTGKELDLSFWTDCTLIQEGIYSFVGDLFNDNTQQRAGCHCNYDCRYDPQMQSGNDKIADISAYHINIAMGKVDQFDDAVHHRIAKS